MRRRSRIQMIPFSSTNPVPCSSSEQFYVKFNCGPLKGNSKVGYIGTYYLVVLSHRRVSPALSHCSSPAPTGLVRTSQLATSVVRLSAPQRHRSSVSWTMTQQGNGGIIRSRQSCLALFRASSFSKQNMALLYLYINFILSPRQACLTQCRAQTPLAGCGANLVKSGGGSGAAFNSGGGGGGGGGQWGLSRNAPSTLSLWGGASMITRGL